MNSKPVNKMILRSKLNDGRLEAKRRIDQMLHMWLIAENDTVELIEDGPIVQRYTVNDFHVRQFQNSTTDVNMRAKKMVLTISLDHGEKEAKRLIDRMINLSLISGNDTVELAADMPTMKYTVRDFTEYYKYLT